MRANYQSGIIAEASPDALFVTLNVRDGCEPEVFSALRKVQDEIERLRSAFTGQALHAVVAIGSEFWNKVSKERPAGLKAFPAMESMPHTPADLLLHLRSQRHDVTYELARRLMSLFGENVEIAEEISGFKYMDARDLTGFVDGTENPQGDHKKEVAIIGDEDPAFSGGSYIHLQRYIHNFNKWDQQAIKQQEDTYGRTKADNIEYPSAEKPLTAHTKRTSLKDEEGKSVEILRLSMPYGNLQEAGLLFASYCRTPDNFTKMLESMVKGDGQGYSDRLLNFTQAVTGQAFFAPPLEWFKRL